MRRLGRGNVATARIAEYATGGTSGSAYPARERFLKSMSNTRYGPNASTSSHSEDSRVGTHDHAGGGHQHTGRAGGHTAQERQTRNRTPAEARGASAARQKHLDACEILGALREERPLTRPVTVSATSGTARRAAGDKCSDRASEDDGPMTRAGEGSRREGAG